MATRMNMLKLLQEVREFAQFAQRSSEPRPTGPLVLQFRPLSRRKALNRRKHFIRVHMRELPDIPCPVPITHLSVHSRRP